MVGEASGFHLVAGSALMADEEDDRGADKPFDASQQKLDRARQKGEIPRSADLYTFASYLGVVTVMMLWGAEMLEGLAVALLPYIDHPEKIAPLVFGSGNPSGFLSITGSQVFLLLLPGFILPFGAMLAVGFATRSLVLSPSRLLPKISRISPLEGAKRKFGKDGWFEFFKSASKLLVMLVVLGYFIAQRAEGIIGLTGAEPRQAIHVMLSLCLEFLAWAIVVIGLIAAGDWTWQRASHLNRNRMSLQELRDETKDAEGDPHLKSARRQRAQEIAMNQMIGKVAGSDVVIVNPTHFAVCLKWSRKPGDAPECVAKGVDEIALAIRKAAQSDGVPVYSDPPTARALFADIKIGQQIGVDHFRAVAAAIRFSEEMRRRARKVSP